MLIRNLVLEDFRQYRGVQRLEFPVDPGSGRNIVLIGGLNGAGKTSILEGLRLALFGRLNEGLWQHTSYKAYMRQCLNKAAAASGKREMHLAVELDVGDVKSSSTLRIERRWRFSETLELASESLRLFSNDKEKLGFSPEDCELYIQERIPYGASQFVFFDGEKIQDLAKNDGFADNIQEAIHAILGLQLHKELEHDLEQYERTMLREHTDSEEFRLAEQAHERAKKRCEEAKSKLVVLHREQAEAQLTLEEIHAERRRLGNRQLRDRHEIDEALLSLRSQREDVRRKMVNLLSHEMPLVLMQPLLVRLKARLQGEAQVEQTRVLQSLLQSRREELTAAYERAGGTNPLAHAASLDTILGQAGPEVPLVHSNLSIDQKYALISRIDEAQQQVAAHVESVIQELDLVDGRIAKVMKDKRSLPTDAEELHLLEREQAVMEQIRNLMTTVAEAKVEERDALNELATSSRSLKSAEQKANLSREIDIKVRKSREIRAAISSFIDRLAKAKANDVGRYLTRMFLSLARKEAFVQEFVVNPDTFAIDVLDHTHSPIDLQTLSAGEKEIFAISFLWSLGKASVQELPMVIDTPLGRLDSIHRAHIAERFLPEANRQVLVLSTDTEIDSALYELLAPYVAAAFRLEYDMQEQATRIVSGYFFGQEVEKRVG